MTSFASLPTAAPQRPGASQSGLQRHLSADAVRRRNRRVEDHQSLVRPLAIHYARRCREPWEDLLQVGLLGLIRASELYRPETGTPFDAFARPHIRGAILHYLRDLAPGVRLPRRQAELQARLQRQCRNEGWTGPGAPGSAPRRERLDGDETQWALLLQHRQLNRPLPLHEQQLEELAGPPQEEVEERLCSIRELLEQLDPRQRRVVQQVVLAGCSYRQLAAEMDISPMTVQRLLQRGLGQLRQQVEARELRESRRWNPAPSGPRVC
jgi:RNA polymerase sigma-B factor